MVRPGMINLDFADVETVMSSSGKAMMGTGEADGENRAMAATELALNNPLIDEYTLQGAKGLLVNITGGSDIKLFEVDAAVNKIRAEVDPEAELIFGAIKDQNMNGKIRVSIVATALHGSGSKPYLNLVNNSSNGSPSNRGFNQSEGLFSTSVADKNISNSIDGATALKLDERYEAKNNEEQNTVIDNFEKNEENQIAEASLANKIVNEDVPLGLSIENASYIENKVETEVNNNNEKGKDQGSILNNEVQVPKLFSEEQSLDESVAKDEDISDQLLDQENNEE